jgi:two-component system, OmpR family, sensor histidine kinase CpxA
MRSMFAKIFVSFWIAEILILFSTAFLLRRHFDSPEVQHRSLSQSMTMNGNAAVAAYQKGGCTALREFTTLSPEPSYLLDGKNQLLCPEGEQPDFNGLLQRARDFPGRLAGTQVGSRYLWGANVSASDGQRWFFIISGVTPKPHFPLFDILPRLLISVIVSGLVTFALALFLTRPITMLRSAARKLASGDLAARAGLRSVKTSGSDSPPSRDELSGLVHDFNHMADRLESLVAAQRLLLRDVSHELRSPLARLSVALELAKEEDRPEMENHLARIEREAQLLNKLIGQLLSLSQMESAQRIPDAELIAMKPLLARLLTDAEYEAQSHNCSVLMTSADNCEVEGNEELLYRALENIVRNAINYTAEGTTVEVSLTCENQNDAVVRVMDRGAGVSEEQLKAIFQPFYRLDHARQRSTGGSGVGLAIADRAIRLHAGQLGASNRPGGGLIVEVRIPRRRTDLPS